MPYYLEKSWERSHKHFPEGMHLPMVNDLPRIKRYREYFQKHAEGKTILDVGAGLGLIGLSALEYGAKHVYLVEQNPITAKNLKAIIQKHPLSQQITLIEKDFHETTRSQFASTPDVLVCELWGPHLWNEGLHATHSQAKKLFPTIDIYPNTYKSHFNIVSIPWDEKQIWPTEQLKGVQLVELYKQEYLGYLLDRSGIHQKDLTAYQECFSLKGDQFIRHFECPITDDYRDVFFHLKHDIHWDDFIENYRSTYFYIPELKAGSRLRMTIDDHYLPLFDLI